MRRSQTLRVTALASALAMAVAGTGAIASAQSEGMEPETTEFTLAFGGPGLSTVALLSTAADLNEAGWNISTPELTAGELQLQGVASGEFQMSSGSGPGVLLAAQRGAPVEIIANRIKNEWTLYATNEVGDCSGLDGSRLAIHSEGSPATFMTRNWIEQTCAGIAPEYIILPGSENRFAALLADEIDASPIELSDAIALEAEGGDRFVRLASFAEELPAITPTPIYVNSDWASQNPNTVTAFLVALLEQQRRFNEDPEYFKQRTLEVLEGINEETIDEVIAAYVELEMYDPTGGITEEQQQGTIDFVTQAEGIEPGLEPGDVYNRTYLDAALEQLDSGS